MTDQKKTSQPKSSMKRQFEGVVKSAKGDKTAQVVVRTTKMHSKYRKQYVTSKKYAVHDEKNEANIGDTVIFQECRPMSKTKRWRLVKVVKHEA